MEEYWIDIQKQLDRIVYVYGSEKRYEKLVPIVLTELIEHEDKNCILDFGNVKEINKALVEVIANILKEYGLKGNNLHAAFASNEDKEAFRVLFPEELIEYIIKI